MRRISGPLGASGALALFSLLLGWPPPAFAGTDPGLLDEVNRRWAGAQCQIRFEVPIKKGRDKNGWSKSRWIVPSQERKVRKGNTGAIFKVSDRTVLPEGVVRAGMTFVAEGWDLEDGLKLKLRFVDAPAEAVMTFHATFGRDLGEAALQEIEQWARLDLFHVSAADENLIDPAPSSDPSQSIAQTQAAAEVELLVLGTAVEPMRVLPGTEIQLVVIYEVNGVVSGETVAVDETRMVVRRGAVLTTLEATVRRGVGTHRSAQSLTIPADLLPGVLELRARVQSGESVVEGQTLFEVASP